MNWSDNVELWSSVKLKFTINTRSSQLNVRSYFSRESDLSQKSVRAVSPLVGYWNQLNSVLLNKFERTRCRGSFDLASNKPGSTPPAAHRNQSVFDSTKCETLLKKHSTCLSLWIWALLWHALRCRNPKAHLSCDSPAVTLTFWAGAKFLFNRYFVTSLNRGLKKKIYFDLGCRRRSRNKEQ